MTIDYKKELESAAKTMILVREPDVLIKLIVRMIVQKVRIKHVGILLHHKEGDTYVLTVSRGALGVKIPPGFARMDTDNPMVSFFRQHMDKELLNDGALVYDKAKSILDQDISGERKELLEGLLRQMEIFEAVACIPSYFNDELLGILLLGQKNNSQPFGEDELNFFIALASDVSMAIRNAQLFKELEIEVEKNKKLFIHTTFALAATIDARDHYTHGHTARVTNLSLDIARRMIHKDKRVFDEKFLEHLQIAALLHDIGKIGTPEAILNKNGPLDNDERKRMQEHPGIGVSILEHIDELKESMLGVKYHHERYDGHGYPEGLKGEDIPLIASIIAVADTFDAMTTDRPYRKGLSKEKAIEEIKHISGTQLNPRIVSVFIELYLEGKI